MNKNGIFDIKTIAKIGLMAALVFIGTNLRIKIPVGLDGTMLHFGNVFCLLSGLLFGPLAGGLSAGLGSAIFDLTSEYASEAWITFINKFFMGFVSGLVSKLLFKKNNKTVNFFIAAMAGALTYSSLYIIKTVVFNLYVYVVPVETLPAIVAVKGAVTLINAIIAVCVSVFFAKTMQMPLKKAGIAMIAETK